MRLGRCGVLFCALVLFTALSGFAQVLTGTLTGSVTDPSGAVIPGAAVTATDLATARGYTATTDSSGGYIELC